MLHLRKVLFILIKNLLITLRVRKQLLILTHIMMTKTRTIRRRQSDSAKSRCQQRNQQKTQLFLKAYEYCQECDADISLTIRLRHSGEIIYFNSDRAWSPSKEQLVGGFINPVRCQSLTNLGDVLSDAQTGHLAGDRCSI